MPKKTLSLFMAMLIAFSFSTVSIIAEAASTPTLAFTDSGVTETVSGSGYTIDGTTLSITSGGTYKITGSCSEGSIEVAKSLSNVVLMLDDLTLTSSTTAPIVIKKSSTVTIHLDGTSTLTDAENPDDENSTDETVANAFEGAAIKVKSGSSLTFCGDGTLIIDGSAVKNGIKGGATSSISFNGGTYNVTAANNGIAADGVLTFNAGTFTVDADKDGIKSVPDSTDTESTGSIFINGGTFNITADGDGIQAETKLEINNGNFTIKTLNGYNSSTFDSDTMSCKGLKASGDREDIENDIEINGGTFYLNTADDAVHSDANCEIYGGTFTIYTGDDGVHADTTLILGKEGSTVSRDPDITINSSYEGLEAGSVYIYQGRYYVIASDDGINAAGGSSDGTDPGQGGGNTFNPGGPGSQGGPGGQGTPGGQSGGSSSSSEYNIYMYGGNVYVNCTGDGIDSNGGLYLYGGTATVFSQASGGDNSPLDSDGTCIIDGATVFAAGTNPMNESVTVKNTAKLQQTTSRSANTVINISSSGSVVYSTKLVRNINYLLYTNPTGTSFTLSTGGSVNSCKSDDWAHSWNSGTITTAAAAEADGVKTYTCTSCGVTETQTVKYYNANDYVCDGHESEETDEGYSITFDTAEGASINVYYTQDYTTASETNVTSTVSRNSDTGEPDSTGSGQINFVIVLENGYSLSGTPTITGSYNKLKNVSSEAGIENTYRITKITSDLTISVDTVKCKHENVSNPVWNWKNDYSSATLSLDCADCENTVELSADVTSTLGEDGKTITFTASYTHNGTEYTDTKTADAYTASFVTDENATVNVYYTQDYTTPSGTNVTSAAARDSDTGNPVITGDGQINFTVIVADGYELDGSPVIEGTYKNLKDVSTDDLPNTYRITKVGSDLMVTVSLKEKTETTDENSTSDSSDISSGTGSTTDTSTDSDTTSATTTTTATATTTVSSAVAEGSKVSDAISTITSTKTDSDLSGTQYSKLCLKSTKQTKNSITISYKKVSGAVKYIVLANKCGKNNTYKKVKTTTKTTLTFKKIAGKKVKKGTYYKFIVIAVDKNGKVISTSKTIHIATKGGKVGNTKKITVKNAKTLKKTMTVGTTRKIKVKLTNPSGVTVIAHRKVCYESSNTKVATVNKNGKITAKGKGTCYIYVYAQNGLMKRVKITVN